MEVIIWIIIIAISLINVSNKNKKKQQNNKGSWQRTVNQNHQSVSNQQRPQGYTTVPNQQYVQGYGQKANQNMAQMQASMNSMQQELKARLQERYGTSQQRAVAQQKSIVSPQQGAKQYAAQQKSDDILRRATANTNENNYGQLEIEALGNNASLGMLAGENSFDMINNIGKSSELMYQVNDLIVMGYQADLTFERDFVSEGIDMLNNYELVTEA